MLLSDLIRYLKGHGCDVTPQRVHYAQQMGYLRKPAKILRNVFEYDARVVQEYLEYFQSRPPRSKKPLRKTAAPNALGYRRVK